MLIWEIRNAQRRGLIKVRSSRCLKCLFCLKNQRKLPNLQMFQNDHAQDRQTANIDLPVVIDTDHLPVITASEEEDIQARPARVRVHHHLTKDEGVDTGKIIVQAEIINQVETIDQAEIRVDVINIIDELIIN